jgi:hypothetical protein
MQSVAHAGTGFPGLDLILNNLQLGDNVVWQVDQIDDYKRFVRRYVERALSENRKVVYIRFASHEALLEPDDRIIVHELDAYGGFESFTKQVYVIASEMGEEAFYVFDSLSDLLTAWATDLMIGNFFVVTCPYLYELRTVAYFALLRNSHNFKTIARIRETTQVLIDVYNLKNTIYVHPLKVLNRYSPTMFFPHQMSGEDFIPLVNSADAADFVYHIQRMGIEVTRRNLDFWHRVFLKVDDILSRQADPEVEARLLDQLCKMIIGRDERILSLAESFFSIRDFVAVHERMIGTGFIGGKSVGMLLARKVLCDEEGCGWHALLEPHDSFFIGSDVFHTYIVQNGWWKLFMEQKTKEGYFSAAAELREKMLKGSFPEEIKEQFQQIIEYFGQSPFIVRSSSLLEDAFGNAFAGKYESLFCVNQGSPQQRYQAFTQAIRLVYASTMNEDALYYRLQRGLDQMDEQMSLLVQRVSGSHHGDYFFPDAAGVGLSFNTYVWKNGMDPKAGMLRIVYGLGTRAVDRVEGDYPRIVALDQPLTRPFAGSDDIKRFSQHDVDTLNLRKNRIETVPFVRLKAENPEIDVEKFAELDLETARRMRDMNIEGEDPWVISFNRLLSDEAFVAMMKDMMKTLETTYNYPVDIEFTVNFGSDGRYRINLLQCRPYQARGINKKVEIPERILPEKVFFETRGNFLGGSISQSIARVILVDPHEYGGLPQSGKYDVARLVGRINRLIEDREAMPVMLMGPGRWGTTTPSLGVPVRFSEINNVSVLVEIAQMRENIMPELSFGTHFFQDLVETDIFYTAVFPDKDDVIFNRNTLNGYRDIMQEILPDGAQYAGIVRVFDVSAAGMYIMADIVTQRLVCFT